MSTAALSSRARSADNAGMKTACRLTGALLTLSLGLPAMALPDASATVSGTLGPPVTILGYGFQPPAGYRVINGPRLPTRRGTSCGWVGLRRWDGSYPNLALVVATVSAGESAKLTLPVMSKMFLEATRHRTPNWQCTAPEAVTIHGLHFYRFCWAGTDQDFGPKHGVEYVARDKDTVIFLSSQDADQDGSDSIMLAQTSMLTFHKAHA